MLTSQCIFRHDSIDQTLHNIGVGEEEMTEGFAVFDTHIRAALEGEISTVQRQTTF